MTRRGNQAAFETLVHRYQSRLLAFCRHMLSSKEDAEDVLQEVFAAAYNALMADNRAINTRPWLYRIARNRCLNHLRRPRAAGQDSMDVFERDGGTTTADTVHRREEFRQILSDVGGLPETQRTALLLREIDALSYEQIADAMDTTVASVKSLLVRARVSLAEAAEARLLTCNEVRFELGQIAEGLAKTTAPVRRHLKGCDRCRVFRGELQKTNKALAAISPLGPLALLHKLGLAKLGFGGAAGSAAAGGAAAGGPGAIAGGAGLAAGGTAAAAGGASVAGGAVSAGIGTLATKAAAGVAAAALVTAGAVEVKRVATPAPVPEEKVATASTHPAPSAGAKADAKPKLASPPRAQAPTAERGTAAERTKAAAEEKPAGAAETEADAEANPETAVPAPEETALVQEEEGTVVLPGRTRQPAVVLDPVTGLPVPADGGPTGATGGAVAPPASGGAQQPPAQGTPPPPTNGTPPPGTSPPSGGGTSPPPASSDEPSSTTDPEDDGAETEDGSTSEDGASSEDSPANEDGGETTPDPDSEATSDPDDGEAGAESSDGPNPDE